MGGCLACINKITKLKQLPTRVPPDMFLFEWGWFSLLAYSVLCWVWWSKSTMEWTAVTGALTCYAIVTFIHENRRTRHEDDVTEMMNHHTSPRVTGKRCIIGHLRNHGFGFGLGSGFSMAPRLFFDNTRALHTRSPQGYFKREDGA